LVVEAIALTTSVQKQAIYAYLRDHAGGAYALDMATIAKALKDPRVRERVKAELDYEIQS
jgi:hypothetical protein